MQNQLAGLAYKGQWKGVLGLLKQNPALANVASSGKGYTPLHQAAWHGANLPVIGALLALGGDSHRVTNEGLTAYDIALTRHPDREDLHYILLPTKRSLAQLLRKLIAEAPELFSAYDGNQLVCDRLIACLDEAWDVSRGADVADAFLGADERLHAGLQAITGLSLRSGDTAEFSPQPGFHFTTTADFFARDALLPRLRDLAARAASIPLERHWMVLADLFNPPPEHWGLRGDLFLWMEMRHALCHCEVFGTSEQEDPASIEDRLVGTFVALTGTEIGERPDVFVKRFARGGMSSGMVSCEYWRSRAIPLLVRRAHWLEQSWSELG